MSAEGGLTTTGYIQHHLTNLAVCSDAAKIDGHCTGFWTFHADTLIISGLLGLLVFGLMAKVASKATSGVPGGLQNFVEMVVGLVDQQVRDTFHGRSALVTPLAITIFVWVFVMNAMDLIPVDFLPLAAGAVGIHYLKAVPTTDPNLTFAMSITVFFIMLWMNLKVKGIGGFAHEVFGAPFGMKLAP
ncbi:MAG: F-type H+-transporting ATPase subunit a, partial [Pseudomonadota bacterium]|nr:F-type H+-transporting ATPase subunit a [Pseudomonadota bacterium]